MCAYGKTWSMHGCFICVVSTSSALFSLSAVRRLLAVAARRHALVHRLILLLLLIFLVGLRVRKIGQDILVDEVLVINGVRPQGDGPLVSKPRGGCTKRTNERDVRACTSLSFIATKLRDDNEASPSALPTPLSLSISIHIHGEIH